MGFAIFGFSLAAACFVASFVIERRQARREAAFLAQHQGNPVRAADDLA